MKEGSLGTMADVQVGQEKYEEQDVHKTYPPTYLFIKYYQIGYACIYKKCKFIFDLY